MTTTPLASDDGVRLAAQGIIRHHINGLEILSCQPDVPRSDTPLLFVHGAYEGAWCWTDHFLPWFAAQGWRCYAVSLRGHGLSAGHAQLDEFGIDDYVNDVLRTQLWLEKMPVLIGHSMGGFVVKRYLERYPARAAVLMCAVPPHGLMAAQFHFVLNNLGDLLRLRRARAAGTGLPQDLIKKHLFAQDVSAATLEFFATHLQQESKLALLDMTRVQNIPREEQLLLPLLILGTENDSLIPPFLVTATAHHLRREAHIFPDLGHSISHERDWEKVASFVNTWLQQQVATAVGQASAWEAHVPDYPNRAGAPSTTLRTLTSLKALLGKH